ncbi:MAG: hypothetical protein DRJ01_11910 [Bacteroidetes bacterium]|nr:MAG: hypothetical protein DRJ01_11910 [Bacteroidota bacterium]
MISQDSENAIPSWTKDYAVADFIYSKAEETGKDQYYSISDHLLSKKSKIEEENENYLLCKSSGRKLKEKAMRNKREELLIKGLEKVKARIFSQKTSVSEIEQSLGRLQKKYASVAQFYEIKYTPYTFDYELAKDFKINKRISKMLQNR